MSNMLKYPRELNQNNLDYIIFNSYEYRTNQNVIGSTVNGGGGDASPPTKGKTITLFMPTSTPGVSNSNTWGPDGWEGPLGSLQRDLSVQGVNTAMDLANPDGKTTLVNNITKAFETIGKNSIPAIRQVGVNFVAGLSGRSASTYLAIARGQVYNPNVELIYQAPSPRGFNFSFIFMPKSKEEASVVNEIIMEFKKWSSPNPNGGMFEIPAVWQVTYMTGGAKNKNMNAFKRAALTDISIQDNSNLDMHMSYPEGVPISTTMSLQFTEVDIITRKDHENSGTNRGY